MDQLLINGLNVNYGPNRIIKNIKLKIKSRELVAIVGPSGCGKSTLLSAIVGLAQPVSGSIVMGDKILYSSMENINIAVEKRNIGYVFQSYALWPHLTVYNNLAFPLQVRKLKRQAIAKAVQFQLQKLDLVGKEHKYPHQLSGGEKQRVALGRSLIVRPSLLLLDEPLANIDASLKNVLLGELKSVQQELGITMLYVTHDQNEAFEIADQLAVMGAGEIRQIDTPQKLYTNPNSLFVAQFIGRNNIFVGQEVNKLRFCPRIRRQSNTTFTAVGIRPEDIIISETGLYTGTIKKVIYHAGRVQHTISISDAELLADGDFNGAHQVGQTVRFNIQRYHYIN